MNRVFFSALFLFALKTQAQVNSNQFGPNRIEQGNQIAVSTYTNFDNTPFVPTEWTRGILKTPTGKVYDLTHVHYNADRDRPEFQDGERMYYPNFRVHEFILGDSTTPDSRRFRNGFAAVDQQTSSSFYEVLYTGKTSLLRHTKANLLDVTKYNSATKQKRFDFSESYYVVKSGQVPLRIKRDKRSLLEALDDRSTEIENFITREKVKLNNWDAVKKVLAFYDSL